MDDYELIKDIDIYAKSTVDSLQSKKLNRGTSLRDHINIYNPRREGNPSVFKEFYDDYKDYDFLNNFSDIRAVRDKFTDGYVGTFFNTREATFQFINYMYQTVYFNVLSNVSIHLTTDFLVKRGRIPAEDTNIHVEPLQFYEYIKLAFKGGTNMNIIYVNYITRLVDLARNANAADAAVINNCINMLRDDFVSSKFGISDTDMSLDITTINIKRHKQIQYAASLCILESMEAIRTNMDMMWTNELAPDSDLNLYREYTHHANIAPPANFAALPIGVEDNVNPPADPLDFGHLLTKIATVKEEFYDSGYTDITSIINLINNYDNHGLAGNFGSQNMIVCGLLIELLDYLDYYHHNPQPGAAPIVLPVGFDIDAKRARLTECARHKNHLLFTNIQGIYNNANKRRYNADILRRFGEMQITSPSRRPEDRNVLGIKDIMYEMKQGSSTYCRIIDNRPIAAADISFEPREDFLLRMQDIPLSNYKLHETRENPHYHYISYNTTILNKFDEYINDFALFRIKLNGTVSNILQKVDKLDTDIRNIHDEVGPNSIINKSSPSEILDITISAHYDGQKHFKPESHTVIVLENEPIYACTTLTLVYDLGYILYRQAYYCPWTDGKYDKRVFRYLFLLTLHYDNIDKDNNDTVLVDRVIKPLFNIIDQIDLSTPANIIQTNTRLNQYAAICLQNTFYNNPVSLLNALNYIQISSIYLYKEDYEHIKLIVDSLLLWINILHVPAPDGMPAISEAMRTDTVTFIYSKLRNVYRGNDILRYTRAKYDVYIDNLKNIIRRLRGIYNIGP